ncbi:hypothetical protein CSPB12327_07910 [Campylobacter sp. RM12327]|uniref:hypothetical protein n=1 Tax=Campylobacter sputorum TaxID=206 RepID=UPI000B788B5D|nr:MULTISPECIES: hypothetical protein [Campylobacter]ASM40115.1 hypothetical protein CSPB_0893 [Campylobacter sputorum]MBF6670060.1 hypothetical protein [Campylobacter sp. RM12327]MBF6675188.1 hypothetical protein [Campylobacter sp. RM13538]MBF6676800.1 hypothetical protein [Campylobacter sp. RM12321]MBF6678554.1 hypothetical protein [Campylobacter sp. RM11259]
MRQEFISFHLDIPKEREDLVDFARWLVSKVNNIKNSVDTKNVDNEVEEKLEKAKDFIGVIKGVDITNEQIKEVRALSRLRA